MKFPIFPNRWRLVSLALISLTALFASGSGVSGSTFTVSNNGDAGVGSLRQAIIDANAHANVGGPDLINFNIPGSGVKTITPTFQTPLPTIDSPVVIDGYTQPGASANTLANGDNAVILIEISGAIPTNNGDAFVITSGGAGSTIRGLAIDRGWDAGVVLINSPGNVIEGCFIGTDTAGLVAHGNTNGVRTEFGGDSSSTVIGGTTPATRNIISGNGTDIFLRGGTNTIVQGNFIGTDATGTVALSTGTGLDVRTSNNLIGGSSTAARNVIARSGGGGGVVIGVDISSPTANRIQGNFIGTDATGTKALGAGDGIRLNLGTSGTQVGGLTATPGTPPGNVISGNSRGILVQQSVSNSTIQGNLIGTNGAGTAALGNTGDGIWIDGPSNVVGGTDVMARNVISGNGRRGILLGGDVSVVQNNTIQGNFIGTNTAGTQFLGNGEEGILVTETANNKIGGIAVTGQTPGNVIAGNNGAGVNFLNDNPTGIAILGNAIFSNGGLGIDLNNDGLTPNDTGDSDTGPNNRQNFPVLNSVSSGTGSVNIIGTLNSTASTTFRLEFFGNNAIDPNGFGEGQVFLGFANVTTDASGNSTFNLNFPTPNPALRVTATATDPLGNTSEFSAAIGQLLNIATRLRVQTGDNVLIGGFIITGTDRKRVIVRGIGPSLAAFFPDFLADPTLELFQGNTLLASNDNWKIRSDGSSQQAEIEATTLAPTNDLEAALVRDLPAGNTNYTAIVRGKNNTTGIGVVEAYDLDATTNSKLANISTRGLVETGNNVLIGGFIPGLGLTKVIVRAIGPTLINAGVANPLQDPTLELHDNNGATIRTNDNWKTREDGTSQQAEIEATTIPPASDRESALVQTLAPGNYTAIVRGANNTTGTAVVEVYGIN